MCWGNGAGIGAGFAKGYSDIGFQEGPQMNELYSSSSVVQVEFLPGVCEGGIVSIEKVV